MTTTNQTHSPTSTDEDLTTFDTASNTRRLIFLVIGDCIVFLVFAIIGILNHKKELSPINLANDAIPLVLGWFLVAPLIGAFSRKKTAEPRKMALYTVLAWLPSLVLGMTFRGIAVDHQVPPTTFVVVTLITNTVFLLIWRVPFAFLTRKKK
jgi:hypothetical protein